MSAVALPTVACGCAKEDLSAGLLSIDEAVAVIDETVRPVTEIEQLPVENARGRCLAQPVMARDQHPLFDNSAMDGFAVATSAMRGNGPWAMPVTDQVFAGGRALVPISCNAVRIFTGAPTPEGCDAIIPQEDVVIDGNQISVSNRPHSGQHIRRAGEDIRRSEVIMHSGHVLNSRSIASAVSVGADKASVRRRIKVAILISGGEIADRPKPLIGGLIHDTNGPMLNALIERANVELVAFEYSRDNLSEVTEKLSKLASMSDLIVTTGGVSVGKADFVKSAFTKASGHISFSGVAIKPGKPISFGQIGGAHWLGLPGNPISAFVTWSLFGETILNKLSGCTPSESQRRLVVIDKPLNHRPGRCEFRFASLKGLDGLGREIIDSETAMHSARVMPMLNSDGLIAIPADVETLPTGSIVEFTPHQNM